MNAILTGVSPTSRPVPSTLMTDSPTRNEQSSTSSPPTRFKPRQSEFSQRTLLLVALVVIDLALLLPRLNLLQEARAQHARPDLTIFVHFPQRYLRLV